MDELDQHFLEGQQLYTKSDNSPLPSNHPDYQQEARHALQLFDDVADLISQQQLFSTNEELDDIRTDLLRYLLVPYYQAELHLKVVDNERLDHLNSAKLYFAHFLGRCEKLRLVHKDDIKALHSDIAGDPASRRATLIARMKREKEAKANLQAVEDQMSKKGTNNSDTTIGNGSGGGENVDEEIHRSYLLAFIHVCIIKSVQQAELTEKEFKMLETVANMPNQPTTRDSRGNNITTTVNKYNNNNNNKPIAYTILPGGKRVDLAAQVFRPGFNMATMTPEQAYEAEVRAGRMVTGGGPQQQSKGNSSDEEDDDIDNEEKVRKARAWDDFKDDNPKGWGNSKRS